MQRSAVTLSDGREAIMAEIVWMDMIKDRMSILVLSNEDLLKSLLAIDAIADYDGTAFVKVPMPVIGSNPQYDWMHLDTFLHRNLPDDGKTEEDKALALGLVLNHINNRADKPESYPL